MQVLVEARDAIWTWVAAPAVVIAGIALTVGLRAPQITRLRQAFAGALGSDPRAPGTLPPPTAVMLSSAASWGGAAAVSAATAVSLGGAGAIAWTWMFGLLLAPLRWAEVLLARTAPPGKAGSEARGSLGARLAGDAQASVRALGVSLRVLVPLCALAWVGGAHGDAAREVAARLWPGGDLAVLLALAVVAALTVVVTLGKAGASVVPFVGWLTLATLSAMLAVAIVAVVYDPGRGLGAVVRAVEEALSGAESAGAFSGALAAEIAAAALAHVLPPLAASLGADGSIHDAARAPTARGQAAAAMIGPLVHVLLATALGLGLVATGAFHRRVEDVRTLDDVTFWSSGFDTSSQRLEVDRMFDGTVRVVHGAALARPLELATERGTIVQPRYERNGEPGDFAMIIRRGRVSRLLVPNAEDGTLDEVPSERLREITVQGRMLPRGARLIDAAMVRSGGEAASRIALVALLLLVALGAAGWGLAAARAVPPRYALPAALAPAAGLALAASGSASWLGSVGSIVAALTATIASIGLLAKLREVATIARR